MLMYAIVNKVNKDNVLIVNGSLKVFEDIESATRWLNAWEHPRKNQYMIQACDVDVSILK